MRKILKQFIAIVISIIYLIPFYILFNVALKPTSDTSSYWHTPVKLYLDNFINVWGKAKLGRAFYNNFVITACVVGAVLLIGSIAAYPLARRKTKMNSFIYTLAISCTIVPPLTALVPLYILVVKTTGTGSYLSIILPHIAYQLPITIFLFTGFIATIPKAIDEAALIDGANRFEIFFRMIMPLLKPITSTVIIFVGVSIWNDYAFSVFFLQKPQMYTLNITISRFFSQYSNDINLAAAGCIIAAIPLVILYLFMQKYFIKGMSAGAIKG